MFEIAVVSEPPVFEPLKFYCIQFFTDFSDTPVLFVGPVWYFNFTCNADSLSCCYQ